MNRNGVTASAAAAPKKAAQRRHPADIMQTICDDLEHLVRLMREQGRSRPATEWLEEEAQRIGRAIPAVFRGRR